MTSRTIVIWPSAPFLIVLGIIWVRTRASSRKSASPLRPSATAAIPTRQRSRGRVDELEDRVRVLERIVTDGGYDLAHKIEALRDERGIETRLEAPEPEARV